MTRPDDVEFAPPRLLVLDDDEGVRALLRSILEDEGYLVTDAPIPPSIDELQTMAPDLVVLDLRFRSGGDGLAFIAALRGEPGVAHLPVVVCSAAIDRLRDEAAAIAGLGAAVVAKPFDLDDLVVAVRSGLGRRDPRDKAAACSPTTNVTGRIGLDGSIAAAGGRGGSGA